MFQRSEYQIIKKRIEEPRKFIQVVMGPRQVGKSTVVRQVLADVSQPYSMFTADAVPAGNLFWISDLQRCEHQGGVAWLIAGDARLWIGRQPDGAF